MRTPYEHFYAWRRVNEGDAVSTLPFAETETMIKGVYAPERFMEIFRDYIYFQDSIYDSDEVEIICRYPQFFAAKLLKQGQDIKPYPFAPDNPINQAPYLHGSQAVP